jgi:hypothetical protein
MHDSIGRSPRPVTDVMTHASQHSRRAEKQSTTAPDRIDRFRAAWKRLGVQFTIQPAQHSIDIETLIVETAAVGAADERLFVGAASWLARYHGFVNGRRLSALVSQANREITAYVGALLSLAEYRPEGTKRAPELDAALARCLALAEPRPLYDIMDTLPVLRARVQSDALPLYARWGLWHDDATLKLDSVRPLASLLHVPEIRARAVFGPSVEADIMARAFAGHVTAQEIARDTGVSYAAAHGAADRLVHRGMLIRKRRGVHQELHISTHAQPLFDV